MPSQIRPWCPVAATVDIIGGRWKPSILLRLKDGPRHFNELKRLVPGITQRVLTMQLRALERDGIVARTVEDTNPPLVTYAFTEFGRTLGPVLEAMEHWGEAQRATAPTDDF